MKRVTVVVFPGSNCDHDVIHLYERLLGQKVATVWHTESDLRNPDIVVLPGGFAYGDYLRTGALAKISPVMIEVAGFAKRGGPVIGICNGFQILCECGLLPGALLQNERMKFLSQFVHLKIENTSTPFTKDFKRGEMITCPIAHGEGNYFADDETLDLLESEGRVVFRYCDASGAVNPGDHQSNPNGAARAIAGICNQGGNVVGLMPHPERAAEALVGASGGAKGLEVFRAAV
jgi:phosphoribosylformylglycinamidine synthase